MSSSTREVEVHWKNGEVTKYRASRIVGNGHSMILKRNQKPDMLIPLHNVKFIYAYEIEPQ